MPGGQERIIRRRIKSVQATQKITRAMELIAASQIVRAQGRITGAAPYLRGISQVLAEAAADAGETAGRVLGVPDDPKRIAIVPIVADRGLCGGYNANVLRPSERMVRTGIAEGRQYRIIASGKKAVSFFRFRRLDIDASYSDFSERPTFDDARRLAQAITPLFLNDEVDQVLVVSTRFLSAGSQVVETRQLLPLPEPSAGAGLDVEVAVDAAPKREGYTEFEPESPDLLVELVPRYVEAALFGALLEASASEHTARQRAMAAATDNADELVKSLTRVMNRARQDTITTEIMEIVSGAEALRQSSDAE